MESNGRRAQPAMEYQKLFTEIVYINLPAPEEPVVGMTGGELLHGFLGDLYRTENAEVKRIVGELCQKWNVYFRQQGG